MAKVTRSGRKLKDEDSNNSRIKQMSGSTTDTSGLRRSTRGTPSKKQSASSSSSTRKSERLEKFSPQTPSSKRKSERVENQTMPQLRRSDRNDKHNSLDYSGSKKFDKGSSSSITKKKEEKREESEKNMKLDAGVCTSKKRKDLKPVRLISKKKRLDARRYRALLKPKGSKAKEPDLKGHGDSENTGDSSSKEVEDDPECSDGKVEKLRADDLGEDYKATTEGSGSGLKEVEDEGECSEGKREEVGGRNFGEGYKRAIKGTSSGCKEVEDEGECNEGTVEKVRGKKCGKKSIGGSRSGSKEAGNKGDCNKGKGEEVRRIDLGEGCKVDIEGSASSSGNLVKGILKNHGEEKLSYFTRKHKNRREEACRSKNEDRSAVFKDGEGSLQSSPNAVKAKEAAADRTRMDYPAREDLHKSESMGSPSEGKSVTAEHDLERVEKVEAFRRKRLDMDFNVSVTDDSEKICTSTAHAVSSSSQGSKESNPIERCVSCSKRRRVEFDSQHFSFCSCCSQRKRYDASFPEEVCEQSSSVRSPLTDEIPVNWLQKQGFERDVDLVDGCQLLRDDGSKVVHDQTDSPGIIKISIPVEKDGTNLEDMVCRGLTEKSCNGAQPKSSSFQSESDQNACVVCKLGGKLLCCDGKGCKKNYHLYCLDPPLQDVPPGVWYCLLCVKKRMELGVHSVSGGEESIWDAKEMKLSDGEGIQKQYLVKYQGLAHAHNRWVPESQLLLDAPALVAKFKKNQVVRWKSEWTVPHRLLKKRLLMSPKQRDEYLGGHTYKTKKEMTHIHWLSSHISNCHYEWFVKWKGLGYEHATWELENAQFLQTPEILTLIKDYESRRKKAKLASEPSRTDKVLQLKSGPCLKLSKLPVQSLPGFDNDHLCFVNKLRECWHKGHNAVVMEDQERAIKVILFILSLQSTVCRPFLVISTSAALSTWESEFMRLAPSVNLVVYNGNKDVRETIRMLEFYEEDGSTMFEVLLSHPDAIVEDLQVLDCLGWEAIIVDECQRASMAKHFKQIKMLTSDSKVLLVTGPIKDSMAEYLNLLSFLDYGVDGNSTDSLKVDSNDNIGKLKERFAQFVASGRKSEPSQFVEYWVPVSLSNVQLEQYCATLLSNSISLRSCSKHDPVGALCDILISTRKCCDHPYIVDPSLQSLITKGLPVSEILDVGVNASGKLQILDKFLSEILKRGLRALILFQSIGGTGRNNIGDFLDDFLRQRFGADSYERVDSGLLTSKKQTALNMFNNKEMGRFVFLIENRACLPSIKLSSVDIVILFDSDWNPLNDLRALQKITIDSKFEQIKVFRLYSSCTLEEKVLILAKQDMTLDSSVQNINCSTRHMLLKWGASLLFKKLDEFHRCTTSSGSVISSDQSLLNVVVQELLAQLPQVTGKRNSSDCSIIVKVKQSGLTYSSDVSLHGELKMQSSDVEQPHVFWKRLLEGRSPQWRFLSEPSQRVRKKVQYFDDSQKTSEVNDDDMIKKRKRVSNTFDPTSLKSWVEDDRKTVCANNEGASDTPASNSSQLLPMSTDNIDDVCLPSVDSEVTETHMVESEERKHLSASQKNLHLFLKPEISKLCDILRLSEDIKSVTGKFLEYIMNNHQVSREPATVLQAFQISLCWTAASLQKQKINRKETLILAKQHLNFECKDEEAEFIYSKLRKLKKMFSRRAENAMESSSTENLGRTQDNAEHLVHARDSLLAASDKPELEGEIRENFQSPQCSGQQMSAKQELVTDSKQVNGSPKYSLKSTGQVEKIHLARMRKLDDNQKNEIAKFNEKNSQIREKLKARLEKEHKIESALIRAVHSQISVRSDKLKIVDRNFARKMEELSSRIEKQQKRLEAMQLAARIEEKKRKSHWLEEAKSGRPVAGFSMLPLPDSGFRLEDMESGEQVGISDGPVEVTPISGPSSEKQDTEVNGTTVPGEAVVAETLKIVQNETVEGVILTEPLEFALHSHNEIDGRNNAMTSDGEIASGVEQHGSTAGEAVVAETLKIVQNETVEGVILTEPLEFALHSHNEIDGRNNAMTSDGEIASGVEQHGSTAGEAVVAETLKIVQNETVEGVILTEPLEFASHNEIDGRNNAMTSDGEIASGVEQHGSTAGEAVVAETLKIVQNETVEGVILTEPLEFALHSHNEIDGRNNAMTSDGEIASGVEQHGSTAGASDSGGSPSLEQTCLSSPVGEQHVSSVQDSGVSSFQELPVEESQIFVSDGLQTEDRLSHELQNSSPQVEVSLLRPPTVPSSSENNQPGAPACTVVEHSVNHEKLVSASLQFQLPPQPPAMDQAELFDLQQPETQLEPKHQLNSTSSQQSQVVTQLPAENQAELLNPSVPESETNLERDHQLRHTPCQQAQVPVQLPESEISTGPPVRDPAGLLDHSLPQPEMQLEHGHLLRDTCSQQVQLQMQPPAEVYAELHNVLQSNTQSQLHTSAESPSSGSGIRMPETRILGVVPESHNRPPHTAPVTPRISQPDPLQAELARIRKEDDQVVKIHEDLKTRINSECQKEIEEIRRKYNTLRQDAKTAFVQKQKALETFHHKVYMNMILAEVFRFKCSEPRATGALGLQQGAPPEFVQQLLQMSSHQNAQRPVSASGPPAASSSSSSPPIQVARHSSAFFPSNPVRPPYSSVGPLTGNYQVGGEVRAAAPHQQSFRPPTSMSVPNHHYPSSAIPNQQSPSIPTVSSMLPHLTTRPPTCSSRPSLTAGGLSVSRTSTLMHEMPKSITTIGSSLNPPNMFPPLQDLGLTLDTSDPSELTVSGNLQGSATRVDISADVVCLSDDD